MYIYLSFYSKSHTSHFFKATHFTFCPLSRISPSSGLAINTQKLEFTNKEKMTTKTLLALPFFWWEFAHVRDSVAQKAVKSEERREFWPSSGADVWI